MQKVELGKYKICTSWEDVKLSQWVNYIRKLEGKENKELDILTTLECFSDIPIDVIHQIPEDLFGKVISKLRFLSEEPDIQPSNKLEHKGEIYYINIMEKLKVKEYLDLNTVVDNDKYNYPLIFAILCRKENELYDEVFIADVLDERIAMMNDMPVTKIMPLISFFLHLWSEYAQHSVNYSMAQNLKSMLLEQVKNIKSSLRLTDYIIPSRVQQIMTLRKLEKSLMNI